MGYRTIEEMRTKDGVFIDRVKRYEKLNGKHSAQAELWNFLYECTNDDNLAYAHCVIMDDAGATYKTDEYIADEPEVETEPEPEPEPEPTEYSEEVIEEVVPAE